MKRSTDRILATHTGKLVMPDAGNTFMGPPPTPPGRVEYEIGELVKKQVEIGMDIISNGEPTVSLERVRWLGRDFSSTRTSTPTCSRPGWATVTTR